jgi:hypothetical protein
VNSHSAVEEQHDPATWGWAMASRFQPGSSPAVAAWHPGRRDVFVSGGDSALWHLWSDTELSADHSDWESLGGVLTSAPSVATWGKNRLDVFVRGKDNGLWHKAWDGNQWLAWEGLGGELTADPAVISRTSNQIDVFVRGADNGLWQLRWDGAWSQWEPRGGELTSGPSVSSWGATRLDVFVRGTDMDLYQLTWGGTSWLDWRHIPGSRVGQDGDMELAATSAVSWGPNRIDLIAAPDGVIRRMWWDGVQWGPDW